MSEKKEKLLIFGNFILRVLKEFNKRNLSSLFLSIKKTLKQSLITLKNCLFNSRDYAAEIYAPREDVESQFREYIKDSYGYKTNI